MTELTAKLQEARQDGDHLRGKVQDLLRSRSAQSGKILEVHRALLCMLNNPTVRRRAALAFHPDKVCPTLCDAANLVFKYLLLDENIAPGVFDDQSSSASS